MWGSCRCKLAHRCVCLRWFTDSHSVVRKSKVCHEIVIFGTNERSKKKTMNIPALGSLYSVASDVKLWQCAAFGVAAFVLLRRMSSSRPRYAEYSAEGKTILVTGANAGIGLAAATQFAKLDGRVILACRDIEKAKAAVFSVRDKTDKGTLVIKHLDLASQESVRNFATDILKTEDKLDVLVNNAGVMNVPFSLTEDGIETTFAVNHASHFLLTNLLLNLLKKSERARVVVVSSMLYKNGKINFNNVSAEKGYSAYSQSKLANILFANTLSEKLSGTGITVNSLSPGFVKTQLARYTVGESVWKTLLYNMLGSLLLRSPEQGAETVVFCALDTKLNRVSGKFFRNCREKKLLPHAQDKAAAQRLWKLSESLVSQSQTLQGSDGNMD